MTADTPPEAATLDLERLNGLASLGLNPLHPFGFTHGQFLSFIAEVRAARQHAEPQGSRAAELERALDGFKWAEGLYDGQALTVEMIGAELSDLHMIAGEVSKVYDHVSGGLISKPTTMAHEVIAVHDDRVSEDIREALSEQASRAGGAPEAELLADLRRRAQDCRNLAAELDVPDIERLGGKAFAYKHAADLLEAALSTASREKDAGGEDAPFGKQMKAFVEKWWTPEQDLVNYLGDLSALLLEAQKAARPDQEAGRAGEVERFHKALVIIRDGGTLEVREGAVTTLYTTPVAIAQAALEEPAR